LLIERRREAWGNIMKMKPLKIKIAASGSGGLIGIGSALLLIGLARSSSEVAITGSIALLAGITLYGVVETVADLLDLLDVKIDKKTREKQS
jgi:hypothetical protein